MPLWKGPFQEGQALAVFVGVLWVALADWVGVLLWGSRLHLPVWPQHHALPHSQLLSHTHPGQHQQPEKGLIQDSGQGPPQVPLQEVPLALKAWDLLSRHQRALRH